MRKIHLNIDVKVVFPIDNFMSKAISRNINLINALGS